MEKIKYRYMRNQWHNNHSYNTFCLLHGWYLFLSFLCLSQQFRIYNKMAAAWVQSCMSGLFRELMTTHEFFLEKRIEKFRIGEK